MTQEPGTTRRPRYLVIYLVTYFVTWVTKDVGIGRCQGVGDRSGEANLSEIPTDCRSWLRSNAVHRGV